LRLSRQQQRQQIGFEIHIAQFEQHHLADVGSLLRRGDGLSLAPSGLTLLQELQGIARELECLVVEAFSPTASTRLVGAVLFRGTESVLRVDGFAVCRQVLGHGIERQMLTMLKAIAKVRGLMFVDFPCHQPGSNGTAWKFLIAAGAHLQPDQPSGSRFRFVAAHLDPDGDAQPCQT